MKSKKTHKERLVELLTRSSPLGPREIAEQMGIKENAARGLVRRSALEGVIERIGYGQYSLPNRNRSKNSVITPQESPPGIIGKNPHGKESQGTGALHGAPDVNIETQATHQVSGGDMEVPMHGGLSTVRIPEYVDVIMFGQVVARVKMSTVVPGMVQRVDVTKNVLSSNIPLKNEEPPTP